MTFVVFRVLQTELKTGSNDICTDRFISRPFMTLQWLPIEVRNKAKFSYLPIRSETRLLLPTQKNAQ